MRRRPQAISSESPIGSRAVDGVSPSFVYVVLAAGSARRMGFDKAATPLAGSSPLERLGEILGGRSVAIVTAPSREATYAAAVPWATMLVNPDPGLGMSSSLLVAHRAIDADATLGVLLADKPFVRRETLEQCEREYAVQACDVLVPELLGERGHPVYFSPKARARLETLPPGDALVPVCVQASGRHADAALSHVVGDDYMVSHWLAAYAVLMFS